ncbi:hypothetical protein [Streptomyces albofaciens]|uniref:hypothetical protein n=1 Tax=Streptomyces albofaciens TaxID=66866 RepID=UPI001AD76E3E|nr:hypothetical protein [Streptomyces albofaciens]
MADDRYDWLDEEAAERLLRGEPAGSPDGVGAAELTALLNAAAAAGRNTAPDTALPGEEAAVAAFRQARAETSHEQARADAAAPVAAPAGGAGTAELGTVRAPRGAGPATRPRFGRPLRRGFMVALAGCALGGVAVAAGVGVLPTPFHGGTGPGPATSVSAAETPGGATTDGTDTTTGGTSPVPDATPGTDRPEPPATDAGDSGGTQSPAPGRTGQSTPGQDPTGDDGNRSDDDRDRKPDAKEKRRLGTAFCRTYLSRQGSGLGQDTLRRLERAAGGPDKVQAFCRQFLSHGKNGAYEGGRHDGDGKDGHGRGDHGQGGHGQGHGKGGRGNDEDDDRHGRGPSFGFPFPGAHRTATDPAATVTTTPGAPGELRIPGAPRVTRV